MKQPDFVRKALGMLVAPLALAALPANAYTLDVTEFDMSSNIYFGSDDNNSTFYFLLNDEKTACSFIRVESYDNQSITLPESVNWDYWRYEYDEEGNYDNVAHRGTAEVTGVLLNGYYWNDPFSGSLRDLYLTDKIQEVTYPWRENNPRLHFVTAEVPEFVNIENIDYPYYRMVMYAPEGALETYKANFNDPSFFVVAEGTEPADAIKDEIDALGIMVINYDYDCVPHASYSGTDKDGVVYAFEDPYSYYEDKHILFRGAKTNATSLTIPEKVARVNMDSYTYEVYPVTRFCLDYYNDEDTGFPGCTNLTDVYVPECLNYAEFHGEGYAGKFKFHFSSEEVPSFRMYDNSGENIAIYVPDTLFEAYASALGDNDYILFSESMATPVTVNVANPGTLAEQISTVIENLEGVRWLVVTGTPDEVDLRMIRRLPRLEILDLSGTTGLASVGGCNGLKYLREVKLPEGITSLDAGAFYQCRNLQSINIPDGVKKLGATAFYETKHLSSIELPASVKNIGDQCFYYSGIRTVNLESVDSIGSNAFSSTKISNGNLSSAKYVGYYAFANSKISNVDLSSAEYIGNSAFENTPIGSLKLGEEIREIENYGFSNAHLTGTIEIPEKLTRVNYCSFANNPEIEKIILHKNINSIDSYAFEYCQPEVVECNILFPLSENGFRNSDLSNTVLYVSALTINDYLLHDSWVNFSNIQVLPNDLTEFDIDREFTLKTDKGIADKATLNMYSLNQYGDPTYGHMTVHRNADLNLGTYNHPARMEGRWYYDSVNGGSYWNYGYYGSTLIPETNVTADNINLTFKMRTNEWAFLSFPFDINVKDIKVDDDALWVVRKYSGEARANLEENTWQNMTDDTVLKAGEGYIFNCNSENNSEVTFVINPAENGNALFAKGEVTKALNEYASEFAHNSSWNLIGNTYPAYLNLKAIEFEAPVTVWERGTYAAYSPIDDDFVLTPFQAFFVQRQLMEGGDQVTLKPEGRAHSFEAARELDLSTPATRAAGVNTNRSLFNINLKGENGEDRTRIVVNEMASAAYEASRDASKFMSSMENVPQIFVNNNGIRMAINETPLGNGQFTLGTRFGQSGSYTISLDTRNADAFSVYLTDNVTGVTTDLMASPYTFNGEAGINDNRFTITIGAVSGVESAVAEEMGVTVDGNVLNINSEEAVEILVVAADGKVVVSEKTNSFSASLEKGIYIVKVGNATTKVNVGK